MKKSTLSFIRSKLYEDGQLALSTWAEGSLEVLSNLLGISLSWEYAVEPVFDSSKIPRLFSYIRLPAKTADPLVSKSLREIFNINFRSQITTGKYSTNLKMYKIQDLTLLMEISRFQFLTLFVSVDKKTSLIIELYPIIYDRDEKIWLDNFSVIYNIKEATFDKKVMAHSSITKSTNLSDKEKESMLELAREILPSLSETLLAIINSTEIETLYYKGYSDSGAKKLFYKFFIPSESLNRQELILNWGFFLSLIHIT